MEITQITIQIILLLINLIIGVGILSQYAVLLSIMHIESMTKNNNLNGLKKPLMFVVGSSLMFHMYNIINIIFVMKSQKFYDGALYALAIGLVIRTFSLVANHLLYIGLTKEVKEKRLSNVDSN